MSPKNGRWYYVPSMAFTAPTYDAAKRQLAVLATNSKQPLQVLLATPAPKKPKRPRPPTLRRPKKIVDDIKYFHARSALDLFKTVRRAVPKVDFLTFLAGLDCYNSTWECDYPVGLTANSDYEHELAQYDAAQRKYERAQDVYDRRYIEYTAISLLYRDAKCLMDAERAEIAEQKKLQKERALYERLKLKFAN